MSGWTTLASAPDQATRVREAVDRFADSPSYRTWHLLRDAVFGLDEADRVRFAHAMRGVFGTSRATASTTSAMAVPDYVRNLPQVPGHVHDASCTVRSAPGGAPRDAWDYVLEALWQVCRRANMPDGLTTLTSILENRHRRPRTYTAWQWLGDAQEIDREAIAAVPDGPLVVGAVRDALQRMAREEASAN